MRVYRWAQPNPPCMCLGPGSQGHLITGKRVRVGLGLSGKFSAYSFSSGHCKPKIFMKPPIAMAPRKVALRIK